MVSVDPAKELLAAPPEAGRLVSVRRRPAIVTSVVPHRSKEGLQTLVSIDYLDGHAYPSQDTVVWEAEVGTAYLPHAGWPRIDDSSYQPTKLRLYDAYLDAVRWTSLHSVQDLLGQGQGLPLVSPWSAALQVEDYQLTPLLRALSMPRVSLLLADDVGLGKTIQAGLIATELIIRRHIRRILIVCPASLQVQWQEELKEKFHLDFVVMDADEVRRTQQELGTDVNPWTVHSRVITSMDYLRQENIYQSFKSAAEKRQSQSGSAFLPWDLLIVDEAHNATPKSLTDKSLRSQMLRRLTEWFEHKVFLTATPHNGRTDSFTGLLETLDPVRFVQKPTLSDSDRKQLEIVMVRRLKPDINAVSSVPRFAKRDVKGVPVKMAAKEAALFYALRAYRDGARARLEEQGTKERNMGAFIFSLLTKRLLSSPYAFAKTWWMHIGAHKPASTDEDMERAIRDADTDIADDVEKDARERLAAEEGGSWLFGRAPELKRPADEVSKALRALGWDENTTKKGAKAGLKIEDGKWIALHTQLRDGIPRKNDPLPALIGLPTRMSKEDRLILFTEYKDTQEYLVARLEEAGYKEPAVRLLYGGMAGRDRDDVKEAFNEAESDARILVATDAASEGLNLQRMCRYVAHYDIPWNPMRLEQRNGRVDRHGQARDVTVFHYSSEEEADQQFLAKVMAKVHEVRHDLGSVGSVIDETVASYFWGRGTTQDSLDQYVERARAADVAKADLQNLQKATADDFHGAMQRFDAASRKHGLQTDRIRNVVETYLELHGAKLQPAAPRTFMIQNARGSLRELLLRHLATRDLAMPQVAFDPKVFEETLGGRPLFRPRRNVRLIRLGSPITQASLAFFRRAMWGQEERVHRWTIAGYRPEIGTDAYLEFQYLLTARNHLQEIVASEVGSWWGRATPNGIVLQDDKPELPGIHELNDAAASEWWSAFRPGGRLRKAWTTAPDVLEQAKDKLIALEKERLTQTLKAAEKQAGQKMRDDLKRRLEEIRKDRGEDRRKKLQQMLIEAEKQALQLTFNPAENARRKAAVENLQKRLDEAELAVWERNQKALEERIQRDHDRYVNEILPNRHKLSDILELTEVGIKVYVPNTGVDS